MERHRLSWPRPNAVFRIPTLRPGHHPVRRVGFEPTRPEGQWLLRPSCLPFHHRRTSAKSNSTQCSRRKYLAPEDQGLKLVDQRGRRGQQPDGILTLGWELAHGQPGTLRD